MPSPVGLLAALAAVIQLAGAVEFWDLPCGAPGHLLDIASACPPDGDSPSPSTEPRHCSQQPWTDGAVDYFNRCIPVGEHPFWLTGALQSVAAGTNPAHTIRFFPGSGDCGATRDATSVDAVYNPVNRYVRSWCCYSE